MTQTERKLSGILAWVCLLILCFTLALLISGCATSYENYANKSTEIAASIEKTVTGIYSQPASAQTPEGRAYESAMKLVMARDVAMTIPKLQKPTEWTDVADHNIQAVAGIAGTSVTGIVGITHAGQTTIGAGATVADSLNHQTAANTGAGTLTQPGTSPPAEVVHADVVNPTVVHADVVQPVVVKTP